MPNQHGDLSMTEAAKYLGVSDSIMESLYVAPGGPLYLLGTNPEMQAAGPWFAKADLDRFRPRLFAVLATIKPPPTGTIITREGAPKSHLS